MIPDSGFIFLNKGTQERYSLVNVVSDLSSTETPSTGSLIAEFPNTDFSTRDFPNTGPPMMSSLGAVQSSVSHQVSPGRPFKPPVVARINRSIICLVVGLCLLILTLALIGCLVPGGITGVVVGSLVVIPFLSLIIFSLVSIFYQKRALLFSGEFKKLETSNAELRSKLRENGVKA